MQKIILAIIVFLAVVGGGIAFVILNPPQEETDREQEQTEEPQGQEQDLNEAFLEELRGRHPEGEAYVAAMIEARALLQDEDEANDLFAILDIGTYLNLLGEKELALGWYQGALERDPANILALNNAANILDELERYEESEAIWLLLIDFYPDKPQFYRSLGYLYRYRLNKTPAEIEVFFDQGLKAANNHVDLLTWLVSYYLEIGDNPRFAKYANLLNASSQSQ